MYNYPVELYHFGIPHRSGRYPWGSGARPFQSEEGKAQRRKKRQERLIRRTEKKFSKFESKISDRQRTADKEFNKAEKKSVSRFASQKGIDKAMGSAIEAQRMVHNMEYKGGQYYKKQMKKFDKMGITMNPELQQIGERYLSNIDANSKQVYQMTLYDKTYRK